MISRCRADAGEGRLTWMMSGPSCRSRRQIVPAERRSERDRTLGTYDRLC